MWSPLSQGHKQLILQEADEWIGTPFIHGQKAKGFGCDCVGLLLGVFQSVGLLQDCDPGFYTPDWWVHKDEENYLDRILFYCDNIDVQEKDIGDILYFKFARVVGHAGIYIGDNEFIHAVTEVGVIKSSLETKSWSRRLQGVARIKEGIR